jgi:hypothetical protein
LIIDQVFEVETRELSARNEVALSDVCSASGTNTASSSFGRMSLSSISTRSLSGPVAATTSRMSLIRSAKLCHPRRHVAFAVTLPGTRNHSGFGYRAKAQGVPLEIRLDAIFDAKIPAIADRQIKAVFVPKHREDAWKPHPIPDK